MNPWLQAAVSAFVGVLTATAAFLGVRFSTRGNDRATVQRELAARREEWWRRFTFASELALDEDEHKRVSGLMLLTALAQSELAGPDEWRMLDVFPQQVLDEPPDEGDE